MKTLKLFLVLILLIACQKEEPNTITVNDIPPIEAEATEDTLAVDTLSVVVDTTFLESDDYGPFGVGSTWYYRFRKTTFSDIVYEEDSIPQVDSCYYFYKIEIVKDTIIGEIEYVKKRVEYFHEGFDEEPYEAGYSYSHINDGEHFYGSTKEGDMKPIKFLEVDEPVGFTWVTDTITEYPENIGVAQSFTHYEILEKIPVFELDGQIFKDVIKLAVNSNSIINGTLHNFPSFRDRYYAKGVGFIFSDHYPPSQRWQTKLLSYEIVPY